MASLTRLLLFVHITPPRDAAKREQYAAKWREIINIEGPNEEAAICILSSSRGEMAELVRLAQDRFGDRCVLDPHDASPATQILLAEDLQRTLSTRGRFMEWTPYEIWTSGTARRWTEGLRRELRDRGHTYDPDTLHVVSCGQQWAGCLTKYSMLIPKYLGVTKTPEVRVDLSPDAGWPFEARFAERVPMERHVSLFLFETPEGRPMAQFLDGLRAIWEHPHVAIAALDPADVELHTSVPNEHLAIQGPARATEHGIVADVGDGCQPRLTTVFGKKGAFRTFRDALAAARIEPRK